MNIKYTKDEINFHPYVWIIIFGVILSRIGITLSVPFLTLFLHEKLKISLFDTGIIVGSSFFAYIIGGFVGGILSDRYGRIRLILVALLTYALGFLGFGFAGVRLHVTSHIIIVFLLLNILIGVSRAWSEAIGQALIADFTTSEQKRAAFSFRYMAANVGAAIGPLLGAILGFSGSMHGFYVTSVFLLAYFVLFFVLTSYYKDYVTDHSSQLKPSNSQVSFVETMHILLRDKALRYFVMGCAIVYFGYVQQEALFGEIILHHFGSTHLFSLMLSVNAVFVILLQVPLVKLLEDVSPLKNMMVGTFLVALGIAGVGFAGIHVWLYFVSEIIFTLGEMLIFPFSGVVIDSIAPEHLRGAYFGANTFQFIGRAIGPAIGGILLQHFSVASSMLFVGIIVIMSLPFWYQGFRIMQRNRNESFNKIPATEQETAI